MKTRAAILRETNTKWTVEEIELDPPRAGEILVKATAAGLCHSDEQACKRKSPFQGGRLYRPGKRHEQA